MSTHTAAVDDTSKRNRRSAPQLTFDDGSRAVMENPAVEQPQSNHQASRRDESTSIREYYEVDRLVEEINHLRTTTTRAWKDRIALQFPDELLADAPDVCWEFESSLSPSTLVFTLGDTSDQPGCPDEVAAAHLEADCIVHYGHACLVTCHMPVLYSFGKADMVIDRAVPEILQAAQKNAVSKLLVLYQVQYHAEISLFVQKLQEQSNVQVLRGTIPKAVLNQTESARSVPKVNSDEVSCKEGDQCCLSPSVLRLETDSAQQDGEGASTDDTNLYTGGLELPQGLNETPFTLLFVCDDSSRPFMNIVLRFLSSTNSGTPEHYWVWKPKETRLLQDELSPHFQRQLNRRFYMVQKAKMALVFGILVANLSDRTTRSVVQALSRMIQESSEDRKSYIFAVGKINPAKLANFAEIECFVLVAAPEHSLLDNEREFPTPIITPAELSMALGVTEWGQVEYSLNVHDFLKYAGDVGQIQQNGDDDDSEDDTPYFNPVSGRYESIVQKKGSERNKTDALQKDLSTMPGQGVLTTYKSAAAEFLKQREYQGLQIQPGQTKVQVATVGQDGIASKYNNR